MATRKTLDFHRAVRVVRDFWFRPTQTSTIAVLRIAYGTVVLGWAASVAPDLLTFFGPNGWLPRQPGGWGVLRYVNSSAGVVVVFGAFVAALIALIAGYRTRIASVAVFVLFSSLLQRNPFIVTGGESLLRITGLFLMFAPAGESMSLDHGVRPFPLRAPWAQRLIQVQVSVMYFCTVLIKLSGHTWPAGTAVGYAWQVAPYTRVPVPPFLANSLAFLHVVTWGTLVVESTLAVLVWNRRLRPWVLGAGVLLHLSIELTMKVGFFSWAVLVAYIAFVPEDTMARWLRANRGARAGDESDEHAVGVVERAVAGRHRRVLGRVRDND